MKIRIVLALFIFIAGAVSFACRQKDQSPEKAIANTLVAQVGDLEEVIHQLVETAKGKAPSPRRLQQLFIQSRISYKKFEWAAEYYMPSATRFVNGPPVREVELMNGQRVFEPRGLQVIESLLFPVYDASNQQELLGQLHSIEADCVRYKAQFTNVDLFNWQIFDAGKLEVFRILTLGISGFDAALSLNSIEEAATSLTSLRNVFSHYSAESSADLSMQISAATAYLQENANFNTFNRAVFITQYVNKISAGITLLQQQLQLPLVKYNRLLNQEAKTLFDEKAFNPGAYAAGLEPETDKQIALGRQLFFDPRLSGTGERSCASCHQPQKAFTDGLAKNFVLGGTSTISRNTPTLINTALQPAQFYDMRVYTLEDQANDVIKNKLEMHGSINLSALQFWRDKTYRQKFSEAYPRKNRSSIDTTEVINAIASYVRSLVLLNSRFDAYMQGDSTALKAQEINGFNLFMGKAKCGTCHYMPLFNGVVPPAYLTADAEVLGVPASAGGKIIDPDVGRFAMVPIESYMHAFKTPTVRNAGRTAPYMHNGVFASLKEVVDFYNEGGGAGLGIRISSQTLPPDKLHLTPEETEALVAFMKSLDSR